MPLILFEKYVKTTRATIKKLDAMRCLKIGAEEIYRNPLDILRIDQTEPLYELEGEQLYAYEGIKNRIQEFLNPSPVLRTPSPARGEGE